MNGFKAVSRKLLTDPRVEPLRPVFVRYSLQYYFNFIAAHLKLRIIEIPVSRSYPGDNTSYSKIGGLSGRMKILAELFSTVTGRYNP
jgi:dolichol-phosphate mannosyltransferase